MKKYSILFLFVSLMSTTAYAAIDVTSDSSTWSIILDGNNFDPGQDIQAAAAVDLNG